MRKSFWVIEKQGPSYLAITEDHNIVWNLDIKKAFQVTNEYDAMSLMFALQKLVPTFFPAAPYAAEHQFLGACAMAAVA